MATEYRTIEMRKEGAAEMEQVLRKNGFQFIKKEIKVWYWNEPVNEYTILCDVYLFGKISDVIESALKISEDLNKNFKAIYRT